MNAREKERDCRVIVHLTRTPEQRRAYEDAMLYRAGFILECASPRRMRLVADAIEGEEFQPTPTCENIVAAWLKARHEAARTPTGYEAFALPTLREVHACFVSLFGEGKCPADWTIRKTLKRLGLGLRQDTIGRPNKEQARINEQMRASG